MGEMSTGRGKTGKGLGKTGAKRIKRIGAQEKPSIGKASIRRFCRRAAILRVGATCYGPITDAMRDFVNNVVSKASIYTFHAKRLTVSLKDVLYALRRQGLVMYGYGPNR